MSAAELLAELQRQGVRLELVGNDLVCRGRRSALTGELVARLRECKPELVHRLGSATTTTGHLRLVHPSSAAREAALVRALAHLVVADMDAEE